MKKILPLLLIVFVCFISQAQNLQIKIDSLSVSFNKSEEQIKDVTESVDNLSKQVNNLSYLVETQKDIISQEQSAIENSIGVVNCILTIFSILFAIFSVFLSWWINRKEKKVESILKQVEAKKVEVEKLEKKVESILEQVETKKEEVEKLEEKTSEIKKEILKLNEEISSDMGGLYDRLKKEETISLFKRLVDVPEDIINIHQLLYARDIDIKNFKYLITSYRKFKSINIDENDYPSYEGLFLTLFFQHFCGQAIAHNLVRNDLIARFSNCINCAFSNDIKDSTKSLVLCLNKDNTIENKVDILFEYIKALNESKHKESLTPYEIIVRKYNYKDDLIQVWERLASNSIVIKQFGGLLCKRLSYDEVIVSKIKKYIEETENSNSNELNRK